MKKIGIITLCGNENFGNKLQNYATISILDKNNDFDIYTIWISNPFCANKLKQYIKFLRNELKDSIKKRNRVFKKFNNNLKIYPRKIICDNDINKIEKEFDFMIIGSDQVWNPNLMNNYDIYFLSKYSKYKKIPFSASFGTSEFSEKIENNFKKELAKFGKISVRENTGKAIIEKLTGKKDVDVLIDPTMLLSAEEWDKVSKRPEQINLFNGRKYILNYFLGNLSEQRKTEIERIAKENDCEIINILDEKDPFFVSGPSEFLYLEKNAFLICTDSFHSSVFAILYNRPFVIFDREQEGVEKMNSRIDTLISKFNLKNRKYNGSKITKENLEHDYTEAYKILEEERKKSDAFLKKALDIKESE